MPPTRSPQRLFLLNTLANMAGQFWAKILALLVIPWLFVYLGDARWAVYGLGLTVMFLATLADPGLKYGHIKVFAEFIAAGRGADIRRLLAASFLIYCVVGAAGFLAARLAIEPILDLAGVDDNMRPDARLFFLAALAALLISESFVIFRHLLFALQRMTQANLLGSVGSLVHYLGIAAAIHFDWGMRGVSAAFLGAALLQGIFYSSSLPGALARVPRGRPPESYRHLLGYLFRFAWRLKIAANCNTVVLQSDKLFISNFVGFQTAGRYQLGSQLAIVVNDFVILSVSALLPAATTAGAGAGRGRMREMNRLASRWFFMIAAPCFLYVSAMAPAIVAVWVGRRVDEAALALGLLSLAFLANNALAATKEIAAACHLPHLQMRSALAASAANLTLNLILVLWLGLPGVPLASVISLTAGALFYAWMAGRALDDRPLDFLRSVCLKPLLAGALPALALLWWSARGLSDDILAVARVSRVESGAWLLVILVLYSLAYLALLRLTRHIRDTDIGTIKTILKRNK